MAYEAVQIRLRNNFEHPVVASVSIRDLSHIENVSEGKGAEEDKVNGFYDVVDGMMLAICGVAGRLFIIYGNDMFELSGSSRVDISGSGLRRKLHFAFDGGVSVEVPYSVREDMIIENDPTPMIDDEDFDFGLFISNVCSDVERRGRATALWSQGV